MAMRRPHSDFMSCTFQCVASNSAGEAKTSTKVFVEDKGMVESGNIPKFRDDSMQDQEVKDGSRVIFSTELVQGTEPIEILWLHDNCEVQDSPAFRYVRDDNQCSLVIADAFPEDSGVYVCQATNKHGQAEVAGVLSVRSEEQRAEPPRFAEDPIPVEVKDGEGAQLTVTVLGHPEPVVIWKRGDEPLVSGDNYKVGFRFHFLFLSLGSICEWF